MVEIRKATLEDEKQVCRLIEDLEGTEFAAIAFSNVYHLNILNPQVHYLVYEVDGNVVGFLSVHMQLLLHHVGPIAEIQEFIIAKSMRNQGLGKEMFEYAKTLAIKEGCKQLEVCCNQKRLSSHAFYQAMGMKNNHYKFSYVL